ncbi:MAG: hypothetical protein WA840_15190 [Caulobacteraceae bacterium]
MIPFTRSRHIVSRNDQNLYQRRKRVPRFFSKLSHFSRVATRCEHLLANFLGLVTRAAIPLACIEGYVRTMT